jgi:hypothetical protein
MLVVGTRKSDDPPQGGSHHRCCMAVVSSCREVLGSVPQRAQPLSLVVFSSDTAPHKGEEGGDDVKSAWSLCLGLHTRYNGRYKGLPKRKLEPIPSKPASVGIAGCNSPA